MIVTLSEVKHHLRIELDNTEDDADLVGVIEAASTVIENIVGPVAQRTFTEWHPGQVDTILLRNRPVASITSVTEYSAGIIHELTPDNPDAGPGGAFGYFADLEVGTIQRTAYGIPSWFAVPVMWATKIPVSPAHAGLGRVKVVYTAGRAQVPGNIRLAALELVRHLWQINPDGRTMVVGQSFDTTAAPNPAFAVPNRVLELLFPDGQTRNSA